MAYGTILAGFAEGAASPSKSWGGVSPTRRPARAPANDLQRRSLSPPRRNPLAAEKTKLTEEAFLADQSEDLPSPLPPPSPHPQQVAAKHLSPQRRRRESGVTIRTIDRPITADSDAMRLRGLMAGASAAAQQRQERLAASTRLAEEEKTRALERVSALEDSLEESRKHSNELALQLEQKCRELQRAEEKLEDLKNALAVTEGRLVIASNEMDRGREAGHLMITEKQRADTLQAENQRLVVRVQELENTVRQMEPAVMRTAVLEKELEGKRQLLEAAYQQLKDARQQEEHSLTAQDRLMMMEASYQAQANRIAELEGRLREAEALSASSLQRATLLEQNLLQASQLDAASRERSARLQDELSAAKYQLKTEEQQKIDARIRAAVMEQANRDLEASKAQLLRQNHELTETQRSQYARQLAQQQLQAEAREKRSSTTPPLARVEPGADVWSAHSAPKGSRSISPPRHLKPPKR